MKFATISLALLAPTAAVAQTAVPAPVDFTAIAVAVVGGVFAIIGAVATALINSHMKDAQAATTLGNAVSNAMGAVQNAIDTGITSHPLQATIPGISAPMAAGVQYAMDHAGDEAIRLGVSPAEIADKIDAKLGLAKIPPPAAAAPVPALVKP